MVSTLTLLELKFHPEIDHTEAQVERRHLGGAKYGLDKLLSPSAHVA